MTAKRFTMCHEQNDIKLEEENKQLKAILKQFTGSKYNDTMGIN